MRCQLTLANATVVLLLGLYACQPDGPTSPELDDPSFGNSGHHDKNKGHDDDHDKGHDKNKGHDRDRHWDRDKWVCHKDDDGPNGWRAIQITSQHEKNTHEGHGDHKVGDKYPGKRRHRFDRHCKPKDDDGHDGSITIIKSANGAGTFSFEGSPDLGVFTLETGVQADSSVTFDDLETDDLYTIVEATHTDFTFVEASCTLEDGEATGTPDGSGVTDIEVEDGKTTTCLFRNKKNVVAVGSLLLSKTSDAAGTFSFVGSPSIGEFDLTTTDASPVQQLFQGLDIQADYSVTELVPDGFTLTSATCTLEDGTATGAPGNNGVSGISIEEGKTTSCTFTNAAVQIARGSLRVTKTSDAPGTFSFVGTPSIGNFDITTIDASPVEQVFNDLDVQGTYSVTELVPDGFTLSSATCALEGQTSTGTPIADGVGGITIEEGKTTTCTFVNAEVVPQPGALNVIKMADDAGVFTFTTNTPIATFTLTTGTSTPPSQLIDNLDAGTGYSVIETPADGFELVSAQCTLADGTSTGAPAEGGVSGIEVQAGNTTTCVFENATLPPTTGSLRIVKQSDAAGIFDFQSTELGAFSLATDPPDFTADRLFPDLATAGTYSISEGAAANFELTSVSCTLSNGASTGTPNATGISGVLVQGGLTTTCTFVNTFVQPTGFLRVIKQSDAEGSFTFQGTPAVGSFASFTLNTVFPEGSETATAETTFEITDFVSRYTIAELVNELFDFTSAACTLGNGTATGTVVGMAMTDVQVQANQTTTCTFVNTTRPLGPPGVPWPGNN